MNCLKRLYFWLYRVDLQHEQIAKLHEHVRLLESELQHARRIQQDTAEQLYEAREMCLEHSVNCLPTSARGDA